MGGFLSGQKGQTVVKCSSWGKPQDELSGITVKAKANAMLIPWEPRHLVGGAVETRYQSA